MRHRPRRRNHETPVSVLELLLQEYRHLEEGMWQLAMETRLDYRDAAQDPEVSFVQIRP